MFDAYKQLEVSSPPGNIIGYVSQEWSICVPKFRVENALGECVLRIEGFLSLFRSTFDRIFDLRPVLYVQCLW